MEPTIKPKAMATVISPHVASWLGTFVAAGFQLAFNARHEKNVKLASRKVRDGIRMGVLGPVIGIALWKIFSFRENKSSVLPIITASLIGSGLLKTEDEVESVNTVIWLRVTSTIWSAAGSQGVNFLTHLAIVMTFYGVVNHTEMAPSILVKMTRRFLSPNLFEGVRKNEANEHHSASSSVRDISNVFLRTFKGLVAYNFFLHYSAALVSFAVRSVGAKAIKGARTNQATIGHILTQATKEAAILNTAVSASCALLLAGTRLGGNVLGVMCVPLPLYFCSPRVRDTVYFLFVPWCIKYLFRVQNVGQALNARVRLLMGIYMLEAPLRTLTSNQEGYAWLVSVAFGLAKTAGSGLI